MAPRWLINNGAHRAVYGVSYDPENPVVRVSGRNPKPRHAFIWPHGGKRRSTWGRLTDIATNKGPDIYTATNWNRPPGAIDGPTKGRWTGWDGWLDDPLAQHFDRNNHLGDWEGAGHRSARKKYDFQTRKYKTPRPGVWMDAAFAPGEGTMPTAFKMWPNPFDTIPVHPHGNKPVMDPCNLNNSFMAGYGGQGGYWHPSMGPWDNFWDRLLGQRNELWDDGWLNDINLGRGW